MVSEMDQGEGKGEEHQGGCLWNGRRPSTSPRPGVVFVLVLPGCGWNGHGNCCCSSDVCGRRPLLAPTDLWNPRQHSSDAPHHHRLPQRHRSLGCTSWYSSCCCFCCCSSSSSRCCYSCYPCCGSAAAKGGWQKNRSRRRKGPAVARAAVTSAGPLLSSYPKPKDQGPGLSSFFSPAASHIPPETRLNEHHLRRHCLQDLSGLSEQSCERPLSLFGQSFHGLPSSKGQDMPLPFAIMAPEEQRRRHF